MFVVALIKAHNDSYNFAIIYHAKMSHLFKSLNISLFKIHKETMGRQIPEFRVQ